MPANRQQVVDAARRWVGTKWRHQGRSLVHGIDCAGLVIVVAQELGISTFDIYNYQRDPLNDNFIDHFIREMTKKPRADRKPGDILLIRDTKFTCHSVVFDIVGGVEMIIHANARRHKVVEEPYSKDWRDRTTHCFSFKGLEE